MGVEKIMEATVIGSGSLGVGGGWGRIIRTTRIRVNMGNDMDMVLEIHLPFR